MDGEMMKDMEYMFHEKEPEPTEFQKIQQLVEQTKSDFRLILNESNQDWSNLKKQVATLKPVLKIDNPEAEKWIREILSRHDHTMRTQQTAIEEKIYQLRNVEDKVNSKVSAFEAKVGEVNEKFDIVMRHLDNIQKTQVEIVELNKQTPPTLFQKVKAFLNK